MYQLFCGFLYSVRIDDGEEGWELSYYQTTVSVAAIPFWLFSYRRSVTNQIENKSKEICSLMTFVLRRRRQNEGGFPTLWTWKWSCRKEFIVPLPLIFQPDGERSGFIVTLETLWKMLQSGMHWCTEMEPSVLGNSDRICLRKVVSEKERKENC